MRQVIPKGTKFPFLCITEKNVPKPQNCATGCELTGKITGEFRSSLLGNDILSCFEWITDHKNRKMIFTKIEDIKARNKQYPDCEMLAYEVARNYPLNQKAEEALRLIRNSDFILKTIDNDNRAIITLESDIIKTGLHELLGAGLIKMSSRIEKDGKIFIQYEEVK